MKFVDRDNFIDVSSLQASPEMDIYELLKPTGVLLINVDPYFEKGIEQLGVALVEPELKLTNSSRNWTISQRGRYAIAEECGDKVVTEPWALSDDVSYEVLKRELAKGKFLSRMQSDGYIVMAREKDIPNIVVEKNFEDLWLQVCRSFLETHILSLVNWSYQSRRQSRLDPLIKDVALSFSQTEDKVEETSTEVECFSASTYFMSKMPEILSASMREVSAFVESDPWAYYSVTVDRRGISVFRHRDARALIWNKHLMDAAAQEELENEALSAWAVR